MTLDDLKAHGVPDHRILDAKVAVALFGYVWRAYELHSEKFVLRAPDCDEAATMVTFASLGVPPTRLGNGLHGVPAFSTDANEWMKVLRWADRWNLSENRGGWVEKGGVSVNFHATTDADLGPAICRAALELAEAVSP